MLKIFPTPEKIPLKIREKYGVKNVKNTLCSEKYSNDICY